MLKALLFDLDLTLTDTDKANAVATMKLAEKINNAFNVKVGDVVATSYITAIYGNYSSEWKIDEKADLNTKRCFFLKNSLHDEGIVLNDFKKLENFHNYFNKVRMANFDFYEGVKDLLIELRKKYKLIVITNGPSYSQRPKIERLELQKFVDKIIVGGEEPYSKPHYSIFEKAMSFYALCPDECLYFGDTFDIDIVGAMSAGIETVWINHSNKKNKKKVNYVVDKFIDIVNISVLKS